MLETCAQRLAHRRCGIATARRGWLHDEYPIARLWRDTRVHRIHGGTSEIMKEVISRKI